MQSSRLGLVGRLVLALLAVFMLGALVASAAQAANEPTRALEWKVEGKVLNNETRLITIKNYTRDIVLEAPTQKIKVLCEEASAAAGAVIGNENGVAISESTDEFSKCKVEGNGTGCEVPEPIKTKPIRAEFVLNDREAGPEPGNKILIEFDPAAGSGKEFVTINFSGSSCKFKNTIVKNLVIGLVWTDPVVSNGILEEVELGKLPAENTSFLVKFPDEPKSVYLWNNSNKKWELFEPKQLEAFTEKSTLEATILILLKSGEKFGLTETGK